MNLSIFDIPAFSWTVDLKEFQNIVHVVSSPFNFGKVDFGLVKTEVGTDVAIGTTGELVGFLIAL